jgi:hypothetical protein
MLVSQNFRADSSMATAPIRSSVLRLHTNSNEMRSGVGSAVQDLLAYGPIPPELLRPIRWDDNRLCQWCGDFCHVSHLDRCPRSMSPCGVCGEQCFGAADGLPNPAIQHGTCRPSSWSYGVACWGNNLALRHVPPRLVGTLWRFSTSCIAKSMHRLVVPARGREPLLR